MSMKRAFASLALALGLGAAVQSPAAAFDDHCRRCGESRVIHHHVYYPHYRHVYHYYADPYAYRYEPRGYYPYYNSGYWIASRELRARYAYRRAHAYPYYQDHKFKYYAAWGYPKKRWNHVKWHDKHHGRHHIGHW